MKKMYGLLLSCGLAFGGGIGSVCFMSQQETKASAVRAAEPTEKEFYFEVSDTDTLWTYSEGEQDATKDGFRFACTSGYYKKGAYPYRLIANKDAILTIESVHDEGKRGIKEIRLYYQTGGAIYDGHFVEPLNGQVDEMVYSSCQKWWPSDTTDKTVTSAQFRMLQNWSGGNYIMFSAFRIYYYEMEMDVTATDYSGVYDGSTHAPNITVNDPDSGYTIKYSADDGETYSEVIPEATKNVGEHNVKFKVIKDLYKTYEGSAKVTISANPEPPTPDDPVDPDTPTTPEQTESKGIGIGAVVGIVLGSVVLLVGLAYLLFFFVFNKWIVIDDKAIRVFRLGHKDGKSRVVSYGLKIYEKEPGEVYTSKSEALKK